MTAKFGIVRSMSKKGCSPDNAACEGFFGRMKNEMYYGRTWQNPQELKEAIATYIECGFGVVGTASPRSWYRCSTYPVLQGVFFHS